MISKQHRSDTFVGTYPHEYAIRLFANLSDDEPSGGVDFQVIRVLFYEDGRVRNYTRKGATHSMDSVDSLNEAECVAEGFVKWDGCTQFDTDIHVDDRMELELLFAAVLEARRLAAQLLGSDVIDEYKDMP